MPIRIDLAVADNDAVQAFRDVEAAMKEVKKSQGQTVSGFRRAIPVIDQLANSYARLAANASAAADQVNRATGGGGASSLPARVRWQIGSGRARSTRPPRPPKAPPILDPQTALAYYNGQIRGGNATPANVAGYNRAQRAINAADPNKQLASAILRSRFFQVGNKIVGQPLGIDIMKLLGSGQGNALAGIFNGGIPGAAGSGAGGAGGIGALGSAASAAAGPLAALGAAATMGVAAFHEAAQLMQKMNLKASLGGSYGDFSAATRVGAFLGNSGLAGQVASGIQGGYGAGYAASIGVNPLGGPFGDMNSSKKFNQIARDIANSRTYEEARRKAAMVGAPELANLQQLSGGTKDRLLNGKGGPGSDSYKAALELNAEMAILGQSLDDIRVKFLTPTIKSLNMAAEGFDRVDKFAHGFFSTVSQALGTSALGGLVNIWEQITGGGSKGSKESATERNTRAINENTRALKEKEIVGGGPRARAAIPSGLSGVNGLSGDSRPNLGLI